ncbi:uncharacterized protein LOC141534444 [Cotesia typhae]|uniref:uncharacterized protein LOC141534444 n=1 Tax=Cotesia typhae TaxID=2053667 RepID=UPI003D6823B3
MNSRKSMMMFPEEIWEEIFKKIDDVADLIKLQSVCVSFNKWIRRLLERDVNWKKRCQAISDQGHYAIFTKVYPNLISDIDSSWKNDIDNRDWRKIFMSWKKWNFSLNREVFVDSVYDFPTFSRNEVITCIDVWDDIVGTATSEGLIYFCKTYEPGKIIYRADHKEEVRQIKFWYTGNELLAVTCSIYEKIKFWNVFEKKEIDTNNCFSGRILSINRNCCYLTYNNYLIRTKYCTENKLIIPDSVSSTLLNPHEEIIATYSSDESTSIVTNEKSVISRYAINTVNVEYEVDDFSIELDNDLENAVVKKFYALSPNVVVGLCDHLMAVSIDNKPWKVYNVFKHFLSIVTAIIYHANILILGFDSGYVALFRLKNLQDLLDFNFTTQFSKKIKVDGQPIISLNVTDIQDEQFIISTSEKNFHVIRFFKSTCDVTKFESQV